MKKIMLFFLIFLSAIQLWSQDEFFDGPQNPVEDRNFRTPLIGEKAPSFKAVSTNGEINFPGDYGRSWKILFSHPQDFTPVCTTELLELAKLQDKFEKMGVKIVAISTDKLDTHVQWKKAMEGLTYKDKEPVKIEFPLVADEDLSVSKRYGMIHAETNNTRDVRGVFIIDPDNIIQASYFYPKSVGRNTEELLRVVTALEKTSEEHVMTPANWKAGDDILVPTVPKPEGSADELASEGYYKLAWFVWFKKAN